MNEYTCTLYDGNVYAVSADRYEPQGAVMLFYVGATVVKTIPLYMLEKVEAAKAEKAS